jgi:cytochrome c oxidase subunit 2
LRSHEVHGASTARARRVALPPLLVAVAVLASGCTSQVERGWMPSTPDTTDQTARIMNLWNGSWIAALLVGALTWGLMIWCMIAYRRRRNETGVPAQFRYNVPMEILYIVVPVMMIGVLFFFTARDQVAIAATDEQPDVRVNVVAKRWAWDFNYVDADVYETGVQGQLTGRRGVEAQLPTLYLPVDRRVEFTVNSRDVAHSFWIPAFLYKLDALPGVTNRFQVVPTRAGEFRGKCAELCGEFHSEMLFNVRVVSQADYDAHLAQLRARGQTGQLGADLGLSESPEQAQRAAEGGG